ncbi:flagellin lysine-N-methylase [Ruminococcus sp.]|uniref:flagellin lysine-N-methylase n=1 Tax=Ruminococcus sp. TaxID=41978 RepID=UPI002E78B051|nr:flagellin lysine-N-methylase [Ruminococcus sp.]MEE1264197.1 flagellin lysine-N-methylase [Ruminococcus sp.]
MQEIYPGFYHEFKCIANLCEDSCCKDWDIDIDSETEAFYQTVQGPLGDKMRRLLVTDEYDERVFRCTNGRCPFWNSDMLCDIYIGIGEEHLSNTCANFPRVAVDYGNFREHILSFACPEAARFMLKNTRDAYADFGGERELGLSDESGDYMSFLLKARERTLDFLLNPDEPFAYRLADCLEFNAQVQSLLDNVEPAPLDLDKAESQGCGFIFDMHQSFEIMSGEWRSALSETAEKAQGLKIRDDFAADFEKFALYYVYRYYLEAINSGDVLYSIKRIVCAYLVTGKLDALFYEKGYPYPRMRILQRYSKEVEHSYDNTEALNSAFDTDDRFEVENLIALLEEQI